MIIINFGGANPPPPPKIQAWPYLKCQMRKGDEVKEVFLPVWNCIENVDVDLGGGDMWTVIKVLQPIVSSMSDLR